MNERMSGFDAHDVVRVFEPVLSAVAFLHGQQPPIIHRDLKVRMGFTVFFRVGVIVLSFHGGAWNVF